MTHTSIPDPVRISTRSVRDGVGPWTATLQTAAVTTIASATLMMALGRFFGPSLVVLDVLMLVGLVLLGRRRRAGAVVIAVGSLANLALHGPIVLVQLSVVEAPASFVTGLALGLSSLLALIATVPAVRGLSGPARLPLLARAGLACVLGVGLVATAVMFATRSSDAVRSGDVRLASSGLRVSPQTIGASAGRVTIAFHNDDPLFPRSLDIDDLHVHLLVPPHTTRRVTFTAAPGTYRFHDMATATPATSGTLTVSASQ